VAVAKQAGAVTLNLGLFMNAVISFVIVAFAVFMLLKLINRLHRQQAPAEQPLKDCPRCLSSIPAAATRCPHCTSELS